MENTKRDCIFVLTKAGGNWVNTAKNKMTAQQHNQLSLASEIKVETKQTGSGHWDIYGYFTTEQGEIVVKASTTDSEMVDAILDKNENTERIEEGLQQAISVLLNRGSIYSQRY